MSDANDDKLRRNDPLERGRRTHPFPHIEYRLGRMGDAGKIFCQSDAALNAFRLRRILLTRRMDRLSDLHQPFRDIA